MAQAFDIIAELQFKVDNLRPVVQQVQQQLGTIHANVNATVNPASAKGVSNLAASAQVLSAELIAVNNAAKSVNVALSQGGISKGAAGFANLGKQISQTVTQLHTVRDNVEGASSEMYRFGQQVALSGRRFLAFGLGALTFVKLSSAIHDATNEAFEFQRNMVRLSQLGAVSAKEVQGTSDAITGLSTSLGVSSKELAEATIYLKGAGLSTLEVKDSLEALSKASLSPTFGSIRETTEGLLAIRQQFDITSKDFEGVLGSINAVAAGFAAESTDLIEAVRRAGAAFKAASGDMTPAREQFNQLISLFTSVRSTTRESADSIATSFRTIFARIQSNQVVENLKDLGVNLRFTADESKLLGKDVEGQFVGAYSAIERLSKAVKNIPTTDPRFAAIVSEIGGSRQTSKVIPLLQQFGTTQKALATAQAGTSSLNRDATKGQDAYINKLAKLREEFLELFRIITQSKAFSTMLDYFLQAATAATQLVKALEPLLPMLSAIAAVKLGQAALSIGRGFVNAPPIFGRTTARASGGIVPGVGNTDSFHTLLPENSYVIRKAVSKRLHPRVVQHLTMAGGGMVPVSLMPEEIVVHPDRVREIGREKLDAINRADGGSVLARHRGRLKSPRTYLNYLDMMQGEHGEDIASHVPEGAEFVGAGMDAIALRHPGGDVVRIGGLGEDDRTSARPAHPRVLQAKETHRYGRYTVDRLPFVPTVRDTVESHTRRQRIEAAFEKRLLSEGKIPTDVSDENLGVHNRRIVAIDPDVFREATSPEEVAEKRRRRGYAAGGSVLDLPSLHAEHMQGVDPKHRRLVEAYFHSHAQFNEPDDPLYDPSKAEELDRFLKTRKLPASTTLYRGMPLAGIHKWTGSYNPRKLQGRSVSTGDRFTSAGFSPQDTEGYGDLKMRIAAPKGTPGVLINPRQAEFLLPRNVGIQFGEYDHDNMTLEASLHGGMRGKFAGGGRIVIPDKYREELDATGFGNIDYERGIKKFRVMSGKKYEDYVKHADPGIDESFLGRLQGNISIHNPYKKEVFVRKGPLEDTLSTVAHEVIGHGLDNRAVGSDWGYGVNYASHMRGHPFHEVSQKSMGLFRLAGRDEFYSPETHLHESLANAVGTYAGGMKKYGSFESMMATRKGRLPETRQAMHSIRDVFIPHAEEMFPRRRVPYAVGGAVLDDPREVLRRQKALRAARMQGQSMAIDPYMQLQMRLAAKLKARADAEGVSVSDLMKTHFAVGGVVRRPPLRPRIKPVVATPPNPQADIYARLAARLKQRAVEAGVPVSELMKVGRYEPGEPVSFGRQKAAGGGPIRRSRVRDLSETAARAEEGYVAPETPLHVAPQTMTERQRELIAAEEIARSHRPTSEVVSLPIQETHEQIAKLPTIFGHITTLPHGQRVSLGRAQRDLGIKDRESEELHGFLAAHPEQFPGLASPGVEPLPEDRIEELLSRAPNEKSLREKLKRRPEDMAETTTAQLGNIKFPVGLAPEHHETYRSYKQMANPEVSRQFFHGALHKLGLGHLTGTEPVTEKAQGMTLATAKGILGDVEDKKYVEEFRPELQLPLSRETLREHDVSAEEHAAMMQRVPVRTRKPTVTPQVAPTPPVRQQPPAGVQTNNPEFLRQIQQHFEKAGVGGLDLSKSARKIEGYEPGKIPFTPQQQETLAKTGIRPKGVFSRVGGGKIATELGENALQTVSHELTHGFDYAEAKRLGGRTTYASQDPTTVFGQASQLAQKANVATGFPISKKYQQRPERLPTEYLAHDFARYVSGRAQGLPAETHPDIVAANQFYEKTLVPHLQQHYGATRPQVAPTQPSPAVAQVSPQEQMREKLTAAAASGTPFHIPYSKPGTQQLRAHKEMAKGLGIDIKDEIANQGTSYRVTATPKQTEEELVRKFLEGKPQGYTGVSDIEERLRRSQEAGRRYVLHPQVRPEKEAAFKAVAERVGAPIFKVAKGSAEGLSVKHPDFDPDDLSPQAKADYETRQAAKRGPGRPRRARTDPGQPPKVPPGEGGGGSGPGGGPPPPGGGGRGPRDPVVVLLQKILSATQAGNKVLGNIHGVVKGGGGLAPQAPDDGGAAPARTRTRKPRRHKVVPTTAQVTSLPTDEKQYYDIAEHTGRPATVDRLHDITAGREVLPETIPLVGDVTDPRRQRVTPATGLGPIPLAGEEFIKKGRGAPGIDVDVAPGGATTPLLARQRELTRSQVRTVVDKAMKFGGTSDTVERKLLYNQGILERGGEAAFNRRSGFFQPVQREERFTQERLGRAQSLRELRSGALLGTAGIPIAPTPISLPEAPTGPDVGHKERLAHKRVVRDMQQAALNRESDEAFRQGADVITPGFKATEPTPPSLGRTIGDRLRGRTVGSYSQLVKGRRPSEEIYQTGTGTQGGLDRLHEGIRAAVGGNEELYQQAVADKADIVRDRQGAVTSVKSRVKPKPKVQVFGFPNFRKFLSEDHTPVSPLSIEHEAEYAKSIAMAQSDEQRSALARVREQHIEAEGGFRKARSSRLGKFGAGLNTGARIGLGVAAGVATLAPQALEQYIGTAEHPGAYGEEGFKTGRGVSGALSHGAGGAAIGSLFGPVGTAIGAFVGAIHGYTSATAEAAKEIRQVKLDRSLGELDAAMERVVGGSGALNPQAIGKVTAGLRAFEQAEAELNKVEPPKDLIPQLAPVAKFLGNTGVLGGLAGKFDLTSSPADVASKRQIDRDKFVKENITPRLASLRQFNETIARNVKVSPDLLRTTNQIGGALSPAQLETNQARRIEAFKQAGGAATTAHIVEATPGLTFDEYNREIDKVIVEANKERLAHDSLTKAITQQEIETQKYIRIGQAIDATVASFGNLQHGVDALEAAFNGQLAAMPIESHVAALANIGGPDTGAFNKGVDFVAGGLNQPARNPLVGEFADTAKSLNQAAGILPSIISTASAGGVTEENLPQQIGTGLAAQHIPEAITKKIVGVLQGMKPEELGKLASENAQKLAESVLKEGFANVNEVLQQAAKALEERANAFNVGLVKNQEAINKVGESQDAYASLQVRAAQSRARLQAEVAGRPSQADLPRETLLAPFQQRQERLSRFTDETARLTGLPKNVAPEEAVSPRVISGRLQATREAITRAQETYKTAPADQQDAAAQALVALQGNAQRLGQALEHLANPVEKNALLQERLAKIEESRNAKLSFTERLATASPLEMFRMQQNAAASDVAVRQGNLGNLNFEQRAGALEHLGSLGEAELPGYGGRKASDIRRQLVLNTALQSGIIRPEEERGRLDVLKEQQTTDQTSVEAQGEIVKNQQTLQGQFFTELKNIQQEFFNKLSTSLAEAMKRDVTAEVGAAESHAAKAGGAARATRALADRYGLTAEQAQSLKGNDDLATLAATTREKKAFAPRFGGLIGALQSGKAGEIGELASRGGAESENALVNKLAERLQITQAQARGSIMNRFQTGAGPGALAAAVGKYKGERGRELEDKSETLYNKLGGVVFGDTAVTVGPHRKAIEGAAADVPAFTKLVKSTEGVADNTTAGIYAESLKAKKGLEVARAKQDTYENKLAETQQAVVQPEVAPPAIGPVGIPAPVVAPATRRRPTTHRQKLQAIAQDRAAIEAIQVGDGGEPPKRADVQAAIVARSNQLERQGKQRQATFLRSRVARGDIRPELAATVTRNKPLPRVINDPTASYEEIRGSRLDKAEGLFQRGMPETARKLQRQVELEDRRRNFTPPQAPTERRQPTGDDVTQAKPMDAMGTFQQSVQSLGNVIGGFDKTINNMNATLSNLANVFKDMKIPEKIQLERSGKIEVVHNGAQLYAALQGDFGKQVREDVLSSLKALLPEVMKELPA